jgi:hypothetical protein
MVMTMRVIFRSGVSGCLLTVVVGAALLAGCQRPKELRVPLDYRPTDRIEVTGLKVPQTLRLAVTVIDNRPDKSSIGQNSEGSPPVPIYPNEPSPDVFLRDAVAHEFANAGIPIESDAHRANKVLSLRLERLWAEETNTYKSSIATDAQLIDSSGRRLWQGKVTGGSERFGRSLSAENYQETLSDAVVNLVDNLLRNPAFVDALNAPAGGAQPSRSRRH